MEERRVLVVANRTLCEPTLLEALVASAALGPARFHVLVPASPPSGMWTDADAEDQAADRLSRILATLHEAGINATGGIGDASPVTAVRDLLRVESFDEIVVSTLPKGISAWWASGVVRRIRGLGLPVTHVVATGVTSPA